MLVAAVAKVRMPLMQQWLRMQWLKSGCSSRLNWLMYRVERVDGHCSCLKLTISL